MKFTRKVKEIGAVFAGLLAVNLVGANRAFGSDIAEKPNKSTAAKGTLENTARKAKTKMSAHKRNRSGINLSRAAAQPAKQAGKSSPSKTLAQSASESSANATQDRVHLTSYLRFGNGTAFATYSNGQKIRRGPALGRFLKNSGKNFRQLV
ncbi:MAG: hypothetical protein LBJ81_01730 [Puniceicoccales bacterium]|jgi:hypothetical protein|nr:hypothetical protein [Puniceicoccales bacterium]